MKKANNTIQIKVLIVNPPTKEAAEERIKKLAEHLGEAWCKSSDNN